MPSVTRNVKSWVSRPPEHQQANPEEQASKSAANAPQPSVRPRRTTMRKTTSSVSTPNAVPSTREESSGGTPSAMSPPRSTVQRKFVKPSTRSPRLKTSWPCSARLRE